MSPTSVLSILGAHDTKTNNTHYIITYIDYWGYLIKVLSLSLASVCIRNEWLRRVCAYRICFFSSSICVFCYSFARAHTLLRKSIWKTMIDSWLGILSRWNCKCQSESSVSPALNATCVSCSCKSNASAVRACACAHEIHAHIVNSQMRDTHVMPKVSTHVAVRWKFD